MKAYYLVTLVYLAFTLVFYLSFRAALPDYLTRKYKIGKSRRKKLHKQKTGFFDRLWYLSLHRQYGFPVIFRLNLLYTVLFAAALLTHLALGWMKLPAVLVCILFSAANLILILLDAFSCLETLRAEYGKVWVFFGVNRRKGIDSVLFIPISAGMIVLADFSVVRAMTEQFFP